MLAHLGAQKLCEWIVTAAALRGLLVFRAEDSTDGQAGRLETIPARAAFNLRYPAAARFS